MNNSQNSFIEATVVLALCAVAVFIAYDNFGAKPVAATAAAAPQVAAGVVKQPALTAPAKLSKAVGATGAGTPDFHGTKEKPAAEARGSN
jgi:hypothetical protein